MSLTVTNPPKSTTKVFIALKKPDTEELALPLVSSTGELKRYACTRSAYQKVLSKKLHWDPADEFRAYFDETGKITDIRPVKSAKDDKADITYDMKVVIDPNDSVYVDEAPNLDSQDADRVQKWFEAHKEKRIRVGERVDALTVSEIRNEGKDMVYYLSF